MYITNLIYIYIYIFILLYIIVFNKKNCINVNVKMFTLIPLLGVHRVNKSFQSFQLYMRAYPVSCIWGDSP